MAHEFWATFSIYDHRTPRYRQALILFDRVVIPVPTQLIGNLTQKEIDRLSADIEYLETNQAAVRFDWDPNEFEEWKQSLAGEAVAINLNKDPYYDTRLHIQYEHSKLIPKDVNSVTAMPVYRSKKKFDTAMQDMQEKFMLEILCKQIPVPADDVALEDIINLRQERRFLESMNKLRRWQMQVVPELISGKGRTKIEMAGRDFEEWVGKYQQAMSEAKFKKIQTTIISVLAIGATLATHNPLIKTLASLASPIFSIRELKKPCWKTVAEKECAPAGVVYAVRQLRLKHKE